MSIDDIKKELYKVKGKSGDKIPNKVKHKAKKLGYRVSKTIAGKKHPMRVCGYYIYDGDKIVYGKSHDLDLEDVENFLNNEEKCRKNSLLEKTEAV